MKRLLYRLAPDEDAVKDKMDWENTIAYWMKTHEVNRPHTVENPEQALVTGACVGFLAMVTGACWDFLNAPCQQLPVRQWLSVHLCLLELLRFVSLQVCVLTM